MELKEFKEKLDKMYSLTKHLEEVPVVFKAYDGNGNVVTCKNVKKISYNILSPNEIEITIY